MFECILCAPGNYSSDPRSTACSICKPGVFSVTGYSACGPCPLGKFAPGAGATGCLTCPGPSFCTSYSTAFFFCLATIVFSCHALYVLSFLFTSPLVLSDKNRILNVQVSLFMVRPAGRVRFGASARFDSVIKRILIRVFCCGGKTAICVC